MTAAPEQGRHRLKLSEDGVASDARPLHRWSRLRLALSTSPKRTAQTISCCLVLNPSFF